MRLWNSLPRILNGCDADLAGAVLADVQRELPAGPEAQPFDGTFPLVAIVVCYLRGAGEAEQVDEDVPRDAGQLALRRGHRRPAVGPRLPRGRLLRLPGLCAHTQRAEYERVSGVRLDGVGVAAARRERQESRKNRSGTHLLPPSGRARVLSRHYVMPAADGPFGGISRNGEPKRPPAGRHREEVPPTASAGGVYAALF